MLLQRGDECMAQHHGKWYAATVHNVMADRTAKLKIGASFFITVKIDTLKVLVDAEPAELNAEAEEHELAATLEGTPPELPGESTPLI